jgi:hypothetical protein
LRTTVERGLVANVLVLVAAVSPRLAPSRVGRQLILDSIGRQAASVKERKCLRKQHFVGGTKDLFAATNIW